MKIRLNGNSSRTFDVTDLTEDQRKFLLSLYMYKVPIKKYDWIAKKWIWYAEFKDVVIPEIVNINTLRFRIGYLFSLCNICYPQIDQDNLKEVVAKFKNTDFKIQNYYELEDINNAYDNLNILLNNKYGILQTPTGSGKTEMIATLVRNIIDRGEKVLVISETTPVLEELRGRLRKYGLEIPKYFDKSSPVNIIKPTGFCRNGLYNDEARKEYFNQVKYCLADEVETTVTPTFTVKLIKDIFNCEYFYGFSATANKKDSTEIPKDASIKDILNPSVDGVISYYGFTAVDALPRGFNITVKIAKVDIKIHPDIQERNMVIRKVFSNQKFREYIYYILNSGKTLFVPVNSKESLYSLTEDPKLNEYSILMITGNGYEVFHEGKYEKIKYEDAKDRVKNKQINLILGTSSCFRGIDFHGINSILLTFESQSAIMKQCIGRLTRQDTFEVYLVRGIKNQKIPFLNSACYDIKDGIKHYYRFCNLRFHNEIV